MAARAHRHTGRRGRVLGLTGFVGQPRQPWAVRKRRQALSAECGGRAEDSELIARLKRRLTRSQACTSSAATPPQFLSPNLSRLRRKPHDIRPVRLVSAFPGPHHLLLGTSETGACPPHCELPSNSFHRQTQRSHRLCERAHICCIRFSSLSHLPQLLCLCVCLRAEPPSIAHKARCTRPACHPSGGLHLVGLDRLGYLQAHFNL